MPVLMSKTDWPIDCISTLKQLVVGSGKLVAIPARTRKSACGVGQMLQRSEGNAHRAASEPSPMTALARTCPSGTSAFTASFGGGQADMPEIAKIVTLWPDRQGRAIKGYWAAPIL